MSDAVHPQEQEQVAQDTTPVVESTPVAQPAAEQAEAPAAEQTEAKKSEPMCGYPGMLAAEKKSINGGTTTLIYSAPISDKIVFSHFFLTQTFCCSLALCHSEQLKASTYVHVYDDRLEYNYAFSICYQIIDAPQVLYLDRDIAELQTQADCCRPALTHCSFAPSCWDATGEVLMLHGAGHCCFTKGGRIFGNPMMPNPAAMGCTGMPCPQLLIGLPAPCLNRNWIFLPHLEDANKLKFEVRKVRENLVQAGHGQQLTVSVVPETAQNRD